MNKSLFGALLASSMVMTAAQAADYSIDTHGAHASIQFKVSHLGYSFVVGRFNSFSGDFSYDASAPQASKVAVKIDTNSLDSNHAERDKHLRSSDFLNTGKFPEASFVSTGVESQADGTLAITGQFTLNGVTKPLVIAANVVGEGQDPWGGYRAGFVGHTEFALKDYGISYDLGPASSKVQLELVVEGVRKQ
ncbi:YceI family protein [Shewanella cyperi]|uniref:YceI family protein n=1 Tax=Shewanella cyperi TaxID=2814292 RepID=A0A975ALL1_9GAMM|nr:YceI family protein [Shewanella cyperi]QSX30886.1 YceI family protein [Shewanella cyperi]